MAFLIQGFYTVGVTNSGGFISDLKAPLCVEALSDFRSRLFEPNNILRSLRLQSLMGSK